MDQARQIAEEVEALRSRFPETRALYREVCTLLFFRYGTQPTTNGLYSLVRKGSMTTVGQVLAAFWNDLREKSAVRIAHPGLPESFRDSVGELAQQMWIQATAAAGDQAEAIRAEAQAEVSPLRLQLAQVQAARDGAGERLVLAEKQALEARQALAQAEEALAEQRRAIAALQAQMELLQDQARGFTGQLDRARVDFAAELEKSRQTAAAAEQRADAAQRRALLDVDQERQARAKADKVTDGLRAELADADKRVRDAAGQHAGEALKWQASTQRLQAQLDSAQADAAAARQELQQAHQRAEEAERRAIESSVRTDTLQGVLEQLTITGAKPKRSPRAGSGQS
ncbi:MAG: KfrA protein [Aquabacterium sp.]|nr:MAG: KfrA protein [Aquabacterium sp.]TAL13478.1 MAG: KfrA protein [Aquabacterium sp.]